MSLEERERVSLVKAQQHNIGYGRSLVESISQEKKLK